MHNTFRSLILLFLISNVYSTQVPNDSNFTIYAFETIKATVLGKSIVSSRLIKYEKLDSILSPEGMLILLNDIEKFRYRCEFKIDTVIGNKLSDSIIVIIEEGSFRKYDNKLNNKTWFIINEKDTFEIDGELMCGNEQFSIPELIHLTQEILRNNFKPKNPKESAILPAIKEILKTKKK